MQNNRYRRINLAADLRIEAMKLAKTTVDNKNKKQVENTERQIGMLRECAKIFDQLSLSEES
jgi:ABC-type uncharacterized transport system YnjBCD ATPase subunit